MSNHINMPAIIPRLPMTPVRRPSTTWIVIDQPVGKTVGYRTRLDGAGSAETRVEVITEGLLLRRLQADPGLEGVAAVILDEIHERSLETDLGLALCLDLQRMLRPELRLPASLPPLRRLRSSLDGRMRQPFPTTGRHVTRTCRFLYKQLFTVCDSLS
jgi:hypothetical protein